MAMSLIWLNQRLFLLGNRGHGRSKRDAEGWAAARRVP
jgi:hypothetical protein